LDYIKKLCILKLMLTNNNSKQEPHQYTAPQLYTTCNNCGDIVSHVDTSTDFDWSNEPVWSFTGVPCCSSSVNPCQTIRMGDPRHYAAWRHDEGESSWFDYVGRIITMYGYDITDIATVDDMLRLWSDMRNSIRYEDIVAYYKYLGGKTNDE
jgi:hypothetical protein